MCAWLSVPPSGQLLSQYDASGLCGVAVPLFFHFLHPLFIYTCPLFNEATNL